MRYAMYITMPILLCLATAGCGGPTKPDQAKKEGDVNSADKAEEKGKKDDQDPTAEPPKSLVKAATTTVRKSNYVHEKNVPSGSIIGRCLVKVSKGKVKAPPAKELDFEGDHKIPEALPGEVDYFKNIGIKQREGWWLETGARGSMVGVSGVVLIFKGIEAGQLPPVKSTDVFKIESGQIRPRFGLVGLGKVIRVATWAPGFPSDIEIKNVANGKTVFTGRATHEKAKPGEDVTSPTPVQSKHIQEPGIYEISCKRHVWQKAWAIVPENPYAIAVTKKDGRFRMSGVPAGTHKVQVWHPNYTPLEEEVEVTVTKDQSVELGVQFQMPAK